jgi:hypothetical protein
MNYFQRRKILKATSASDLVPIRVHGHDVVDGKVVILAPKFKSKWVHNLYPRTKQLFYKIKLDELGSLTWENISGDKTVAEITVAVEQQLGEKARSFDEAESRVSKFMSLLYDWRYITFKQIMNDEPR